jgi:hypothetical protein
MSKQAQGGAGGRHHDEAGAEEGPRGARARAVSQG